MNGRQREDAVHEYLEAKLHVELGRRSFLENPRNAFWARSWRQSFYTE